MIGKVVDDEEVEEVEVEVVEVLEEEEWSSIVFVGNRKVANPHFNMFAASLAVYPPIKKYARCILSNVFLMSSFKRTTGSNVRISCSNASCTA